MLTLMMAGAFTAFSLIALLHNMNMRRILGYKLAVDVAVTVALCFMFAGTYSGMVVGAVADVIIVCSLWLLKDYHGHERLTRRGWVVYPPQRRFHRWLTTEVLSWSPFR